MNILVFSWRDPKHPLAGGAEQVMHEHMKGWVKAGHEVTHFSSRIAGSSKKEETVDGIKIVRMGYQLLGVNILGILWYLFGSHPNFDLVIDEFHGIPFFTPLFVSTKKIAVLQEVAREVWFKNHLPFPFNYLIGGVGYIGEPFVFFFYRNVPFMVGSESAKNDLVRMGIPGANVQVIPHGVILPKISRFFPKEKTKTVIFLGALARDKGIEDAIHAFSILNKKGNFNFWIVGKGGEPYFSNLKDLAERENILNNTKFWGFVSQETKFELLARSHIMINPSIREGWGLVNIEANRMGVPVVAYNSPGLVDSVKDGLNGIICKKNTPDELAYSVRALLEDKDLYEKLQKGARKWAHKFSWPISVKESLALINRVSGLK